MFTSNECRMMRRTPVAFTRSGWKQFTRLNRALGARFIRAFVLQHELAVYLAEHEANGVQLDTECQEVRYEDGVYLLLRKMQGVWYIIDAFAAEEVVAYAPVYVWQRVRRGAEYVLARLLTGWRRLSRRMVAGA